MQLSNGTVSDANRERVNQILDVVMSYARLDFTQKTELAGNEDILDAIGAGVNMLGEELRSSTVSLKEKEQMLKEIHHRVKNNLQIVSSLLNLQSGSILDPAFQSLIEASRNRINSMALVHEMLYSSKDLKRVNISEYIQRLTQNVYHSLSGPELQVRFVYNIHDSYYFEIDQMIPIGLILNEIITNSFKYAFPSRHGLISISMEQKQGQYILKVADDGIGMNAENEKKNSLGLQLIEMLSAQIDASVSMNGDKGTSYTIQFT